MKVDHRTDTGLIRATNQDTCDSGLFSEHSAWAVVCDGMGGANGGNIASDLALGAIREHLVSGFSEQMDLQEIRKLLQAALAKANALVYEASLENEELQGMGTTAVVMIASGGYLHVAHVGDSRAYLWHEGEIRQLTEDHSFVQGLVNLGQITPEQARNHPQRNIITRVVGIHEVVQVDHACFDFAPGDFALACSDGLTSYAADEDLKANIGACGGDLPVLTENLIKFALAGGGSDNVTATVIADL